MSETISGQGTDAEIWHVACDEVLDIAAAGELRTTLLAALDSGRPVTLEAAGVERTDTSALQVLAAFFQDARAQGITVQWKSPSEALVRAAALLGLAEILDFRGEAA